MCSLDLEPCTVWRETPRVARKPHECDACGGPILPGGHYLEHFHIFETDPGTEKMCFACWVSRDEFADAHGQSFYPSNLDQQLEECIGDNDDPLNEWRPHLAALRRRWRVSPSGRRSLRAIWRRVGHAWPNTQDLTKPPEEWELSR